MKQAGSLAAATAAVVLVPLLILMFMLGDDTPADLSQGSLATGTVPPEFEAWVIKAGSLCPEVSPPLIAAQIEQESGWNPQAVSPAGAEGLSQFMPYTWPSYAVDANRNGITSPYDPPDAIMAQGNFDCQTAEQAKRDIAAGRISGDIVDIILNAYNCGYGCVLANGGPNIVNGETEGYATGIRARMAKYTQIGVRPRPGAPGDGKVRLPIDSGTYELSSGYGPRWGTMHHGVDFAAPAWTPIFAVTGGTVTQAGNLGDGYGNCVVIESADGLTMRYAHQVDGGIKVSMGQTVAGGAEIGAVGTTGDSTGNHLHFEVRVNGQSTDPMPYLASIGLRA